MINRNVGFLLEEIKERAFKENQRVDNSKLLSVLGKVLGLETPVVFSLGACSFLSENATFYYAENKDRQAVILEAVSLPYEVLCFNKKPLSFEGFYSAFSNGAVRKSASYDTNKQVVFLEVALDREKITS